MNTFRFVILLSSVILLFNGCKKNEAKPQGPLIINGDIEQKLEGWGFNYVQGWGFKYVSPIKTNINGYEYNFTAEAAASPQYSLKINSNQVKNSSSFCYYTQDVIPTGLVPVGAKLTLKVRIKTVNLKGNGIALVLQGDGDGKLVFFETTEGKTAITDVKEFTEYSVTVDSYPDKVDKLKIFLVYLANTTGTVYFDDISLTAK